MRDLVSVLAEPNRRRLLELLLEGEQSVSCLSAHFGVTRSAISQHLAVLSKAGLVEARADGRFRYYRVIPEGLAALQQALDVFWTKELEDLAAAGVPGQPVVPGQKGVIVVAEKSVLVPLDPDQTFALLTEPERLRRWHTVTARIDVRAGGDYRWTVVPGHTAAGKVVEVEPGRRLVISWGWEGDDGLPPGASTVTITLVPVEGGTVVRLVHEGLTEEQAAGLLQGWEHYLDRLVIAAESGDAGADDWAAPPDPIDTLGAAEASLAACQLVLRGLGDSDKSLPTPCAKFTVSEVVDHLLGSIVFLGGIAGPVFPKSEQGSLEDRVAVSGQRALESWRKRGTDGTVVLGGNEVPATVPVNILSLEFLVHAWDIAQATSQRVIATDALSEYVLGLGKEVIAPQMRDGDRFAAEVTAGPDCDSLQRLAAFTGRQILSMKGGSD
jgi:uncharacterized protein (TIGR03086 family)